ncbi:MAG TPA: hypothetical protein DEG65_03205, partial [Methylophaga sp.]|nr:hypothetical protein [Methylophaga sp.]
MPRDFSQAAAELTVLVAEAVCIRSNCEQQFVQKFCDLSAAQATAALALATDIGLIVKVNETYN